jgi:phosphatidylserine/phosphatidylglycerophosphate/cardiolipin synthase-like enzyme
MNKRSLLMFLGLQFLALLALRAQTMEFIFTNPLCQTYPGKPKNAFCTREDVAANTRNRTSLQRRVLSEIKNRDNLAVTLASMTFSNRAVAQTLCEVIKRGVRVKILIDAGAEQATAQEVESCGAELWPIGSVEPQDQAAPTALHRDLHHNKFLLIERKNNLRLLAFATANFSTPGLSINHETWSFITDQGDSKMMRDHQCLISALESYNGRRARFSNSLNKCRTASRVASNIESFFVPADSRRLLQLIDENIRQSNRVWMTSNRYSYDRLTQAFRAGSARDRKAIFDDDLYWGGLQPTDDYKNEALDSVQVKKLEKAGVAVRFTQTSYGAAQKMHNKFIIFDDLVIVGAGNYTYSGLASNFENFYAVRDPVTVELFSRQFIQLWSLSTSRSAMPEGYVDPGAVP